MKSTKQLQVYEMYRIHDLLFYDEDKAIELEDGKDVAVLRFVVSDEEPIDGAYIEPSYMLFDKRRGAVNYIEEEE